MNIQSTKIELTKLILNIDNPKLIAKIKDLLLKETSDFWLELTDIQKEELNYYQLEAGRFIYIV